MSGEQAHQDGAPRVFLSYTWDGAAHEAWVLALATRLRENGVDVVLDRWDARLGTDLAHFMEQIGDKQFRVVAIVSERYCQKTDDLEGGAGYEKKVLTPRLMEDLNGAQVVPVLRNNPDGRKPRFLGAARHIDFRDEVWYEDSLWELICDLHGRQVLAKPPLGADPFAESPTEAQARADVRHRAGRYTSAPLEGNVTFPYSNNSGRYVLGSGDLETTVEVSEAGHGSVYLLNDPVDVASVALVRDVSSFAEVGEATQADASSRSRTIRVGDAAVIKNAHGYWTALLLDEVTTRDTSEVGEPTMRFRYRVLPSRLSNFSAVGGAPATDDEESP